MPTPMNKIWSFRFFLLFSSLLPFFSFLLLIREPVASQQPRRQIEVTIDKKEKKYTSSSISSLLENEEEVISRKLPLLENELKVIHVPSPFPKRDSFFLEITRSGKRRKIEGGKRVYLAFQGDLLTFSDKKSPFSLDCKQISLKKAVCLERVEAPFVEKNESLINLTVTEPSLRAEKHPELFLLSKAKYLGENLLMERIFPEKPSVQNIIFRNQLFSLTNSDFLVFSDGSWSVSEDPVEGKPLVKIKEIRDDSTILFEGWDGISDNYYCFSLSHYSIPFNPVAMGDILKNIRVRNEKQFSCQLSDTRTVFHVGDALIRDKGSWKPCRDITEILEHKGELFLIESLEKKGRSQKVTGSYFSLFKNQRKEIALEADKNIRKKTIRRKRK